MEQVDFFLTGCRRKREGGFEKIGPFGTLKSQLKIGPIGPVELVGLGIQNR